MKTTQIMLLQDGIGLLSFSLVIPHTQHLSMCGPLAAYMLNLFEVTLYGLEDLT